MELQILLREENSKQGIINLKNYIDKASIEGLEETEIERAPHGEGEMGLGDLLGSIKTIIEAAQQPLVELIKCLQKYVDNYRTEIVIPITNGEEIRLIQGRSMKANELKELVVAIQKSSAYTKK